jgi:hypothetical protein
MQHTRRAFLTVTPVDDKTFTVTVDDPERIFEDAADLYRDGVSGIISQAIIDARSLYARRVRNL